MHHITWLSQVGYWENYDWHFRTDEPCSAWQSAAEPLLFVLWFVVLAVDIAVVDVIVDLACCRCAGSGAFLLSPFLPVCC